MFRLRAGYFPGKESSQSSPGLRARTQGRSPVALVVTVGAGGLLKVSLTVIAAALLNDLFRYFRKIRCVCVPEHTLWGVTAGG